MKYTVLWKRSAEDELATLWLAAKDRSSTTAAVHLLDSVLKYRPQSAGEPRSGAARIAILGPPAVTFEILEEDRVVSVLSVRRAGE